MALFATDERTYSPATMGAGTGCIGTHSEGAFLRDVNRDETGTAETEEDRR